jgi:hypothetical protein
MQNTKRRIGIVLLVCLVLVPATVAADSVEKIKVWTARELVKRIIKSERKIKNWQVRAEYTHSNEYRIVYDQAYDQGRKYEQGTSFYPAGKANILNPPPGAKPVYNPAYSSEFKYVFDGTKSYELQDDIRFTTQGSNSKIVHKGKRGSIGPGDKSLTFHNWGPHELLGYTFSDSFRRCKGKTLGEVLLRYIDKISIRKEPQNINGNLCTVIDVLGISSYAPKGSCAADDWRFWIDTKRDFRPLKMTAYHLRNHDRASPQKKLTWKREITKLTKVDGIWFPIECKDDDTVVRIEKNSIRLNKEIDPANFAPIDYPNGCRLSNRFTDENYIVGKFSDPEYKPETPLEKLLKQLSNHQVTVDPGFTKDLISVLRDFHMFDDKVKWMSAVRGLVLIGPPAVPELITELKRTRIKRTLVTVAFTLRAIGDLSAVDALIDALGRNIEGSGSCGFGLPKNDLDRFIHKNQADPSSPRVGVLGWNYEVTTALEKLTGHTEGHKHLWPHDLKGNPIPCNKISSTIAQPMEKPQTVARRWRRWWNMNKHRLVSAE